LQKLTTILYYLLCC